MAYNGKLATRLTAVLAPEDGVIEKKMFGGLCYMDFTGRSLKGMLYIDPEGIKTKRQLASWIGHALAFVRSLPPKTT